MLLPPNVLYRDAVNYIRLEFVGDHKETVARDGQRVRIEHCIITRVGVVMHGYVRRLFWTTNLDKEWHIPHEDLAGDKCLNPGTKDLIQQALDGKLPREKEWRNHYVSQVPGTVRPDKVRDFYTYAAPRQQA